MGIELGSYAPADVIKTVHTMIPDAPSGMSVTPVQEYSQSTMTNIPEYVSTATFVPGPEERAGAINYSLWDTGVHEVTHSQVLHNSGFSNSIESITVIPNGPILGQVRLRGHIPMDKFAAVAAASSSGLFNNRAEGTGSDRAQIARTGQSFQASLAVAEGHLKKDPPEVFRKIVEMVVFLKQVSGSMYRKIVQQAYDEFYLEKSGQKDKIKGFQIEAMPEEKSLEQETLITYITPDHYRGTWLENGKVVAEVDVFKCPVCGGFHGDECPGIVAPENAGMQSNIVESWSGLEENKPLKIEVKESV